ncbi:MAG: hypothetical protein BWK80_47630 [Desulfobacteraceae bacterium IS3]|nr:MAG: hypothetical protein BWK80_47630 [Desulfobacteraceae bacterium IS3]
MKKKIILKLRKTIHHWFPDLFDKIKEIEDCRKKGFYELTELIMAAIMMFIFKKESRNAFNNDREINEFKNNYRKIFNVRFPHMDTVNEVMKKLDERELEELKAKLIRILLKKKLFRKSRLSDRYYRIVVDSTHVMTVKEGHCENCLHKTSKTGKKTYFHSVLEAKLVSREGFCISLGTEWLENVGEYDKQDCELKAFVRLAEKLKTDYPQLAICIVADGLYPNRTFFEICREKGWEWIVTLKDGNLRSVWEEVLVLKELEEGNRRTDYKEVKGGVCSYTWLNGLNYQGFGLNWYECIVRKGEENTRFVYISSLEIDWHNVLEMTQSGRMRWKIENEGFDIQKNHGYGLGHQYSEVSMKAMKNYYQCMQIAHIINQLFEMSSMVKELMTGKMTVKYLWEYMISEMRHIRLSSGNLKHLLAEKIQFRYG